MVFGARLVVFGARLAVLAGGYSLKPGASPALLYQGVPVVLVARVPVALVRVPVAVLAGGLPLTPGVVLAALVQVQVLSKALGKFGAVLVRVPVVVLARVKALKPFPVVVLAVNYTGRAGGYSYNRDHPVVVRNHL
jgi:hypothetical protein